MSDNVIQSVNVNIGDSSPYRYYSVMEISSFQPLLLQIKKEPLGNHSDNKKIEESANLFGKLAAGESKQKVSQSLSSSAERFANQILQQFFKDGNMGRGYAELFLATNQ